MGILFDMEKWNTYINTHESSITTGFVILGVIAFIVLFIIFFKELYEDGVFKTEIGTAIASFFSCLLLTLIGMFIIYFLFRLLGFILIGIVLFFICFGLSKLFLFIKNRPEKTIVEIPNINEIAKGVYDEMYKINPAIKYEDIYASIEKKLGK